jgi:hypothetical protein
MEDIKSNVMAKLPKISKKPSPVLLTVVGSVELEREKERERV